MRRYVDAAGDADAPAATPPPVERRRDGLRDGAAAPADPRVARLEARLRALEALASRVAALEEDADAGRPGDLDAAALDAVEARVVLLEESISDLMHVD